MSVLVSGATGFVGGAVTAALLAAGEQVHVLVRDPARAQRLRAAGAVVHQGDMLDPDSYRSLVTEVGAVVHTAQFAVSGRLTDANLGRIRHGDHVMTQTFADACQASGARLVYTSGCFNYGDRGSDWITEQTPFAPSPLGQGHAVETADLRRRHRDHGLDVVIVSPGFVYGPGGLFKTAFYDQARKKRLRVIGTGANYWSPVHVDDLASAYLAALAGAPAGGEYNVVDDHPITLRALTDTVTDQMGQHRVGTIPPVLMNLLLGKPLVDSLRTSFRMTNTHLRDELNWAPRRASFADGLPSTLHNLRQPTTTVGQQ